MKHYLILLLLILPVLNGCSDDYDDSSAWKEIDGIYKELDELNEQISGLQSQANALSQIINGGAITSVETAANGGYVISYKGADNIEHSFTIATAGQMLSIPIIGVKEENNIFYWTTNADGKTTFLLDDNNQKIPLTGSIPQISTDADGYWTINGKQVLDSRQQPVKAEGKSTSLITEITVNENGTASIKLGNGETLPVQVFNLFNIKFTDETGKSAASPIEVEEGTQRMTLNYAVNGSKAEQALLLITRCKDVEAVLSTKNKTISVTFPDGFEEGSAMLMLYDTEDNILIKPIQFTLPVIKNGGIATAADFIEFINAVTDGNSLRKFKDANGNIVLLNDIDMDGQTLTTGAGEAVTSNTVKTNTAVTYTTGAKTFNGTFDGKGFRIYNLSCQYNTEDGNIAHGLFNALGSAGVIRNLTIEGSATVTGEAPQGSAIGGLVGYCEGELLACTNQMDITFKGTDIKDTSVRMGGLAGVLSGNQIGDKASDNACINEGILSCGSIANTNTGANSGFHQGGIVGYMEKSGAYIGYAVNKGTVSAPSGRGGGIVGTLQAGNIEYCINEGLVQDDINDSFAGSSKRYNVKRIGGIAGGSNTNTYVRNCTNNGNVYSQNGSRAGGFIGHNGGYIEACTNNGIILSDATQDGSNKHGAGWGCGFSGGAHEPSYITGCHIGGKVGDYTIYNTHPENAPDATYDNAVRHGTFVKEDNNLSNTDDAFYDWTVVTEKELATGVVYKHYSFTSFKQHIHAIEIDMNNPKVTFETVMADEICPNPNGNNNSNNGKNLRETLSETCNRRRDEGRNIIAGINTGFFNSNDGFPRGMHIEEGEPVFVNNPYVRNQLTNHKPGFTFFDDRTVSFENREFTGKMKTSDGTEYEYYSINDTIVRLNGKPSYDSNLYTYRYVKNPHEGLTNPIGTKALFIVGRNSQPLKVNSGYLDATITQMIDGRTGNIQAPYVNDKSDWVLQVTGSKAEALAQKLRVGSSIQISAELKIGNSASPVKVHNSSMYRYVYNGVYTAPSKREDALTIYQTTNLGMNADNNKIILFCIDGKTDDNRGLDFYEAYRVAKKMGLHNVIRFDGGGSTTMWTYADGTGAVVNQISDKNGERSCMNYLHVRILE